MDLEIPYAPHKRQLPFHNSQAKFRAFITGVGCGKSAAGANELLKMSLEHPRSVFIIMAPTFRMLKHAALVEFFKWCPKNLVKYHKRADREIWLVGREVPIIYLSADNERHIDRLRGMTIGGFWLDECAMFLRLVWDVVLARLRCPYGPLKGVVTTTPRGFGWPYYYFVRQQNPKNKKKLRNAGDYSWFGGSTLDNPFTPQSYKQNLLDTYSGKFAKQEIYGEFTGFEGLVFSNFSRKTHIVDEAPSMSEYIISFDWGFTNPTAGLVIGFDYDGRAYVVEEYYKTKTPIEDAIDWAKKMWKKYNVLRAFGDPSSPDHLYKFNSEGLSMSPANNAVLPGVNTVYNYFDVKEDGLPRLFILRSCQNLIDEIEEYRYKEMSDERPQREDHFEGKDHLCFVAGTMVKTARGDIPIEFITCEDEVLTRQGYFKVNHSYITIRSGDIWEVTFSDGRILQCTGNHPVWVEGRGFIRADSLRYPYIVNDSMRYVWELSTKGINTTRATTDIGKELVGMEKELFQSTCIEKSTKKQEESYQKGIISTTKTETKITTLLKIWNVFLQRSITGYIGIKKGLLKTKYILTRSGPSLRNGMPVMKVLSGIRNIGLALWGNFLLRGCTIVNYVDRILNQSVLGNQSIVIPTANKKLFVVGVRKLRLRQPVYNLSVCDVHEYFANGILVSNCDAARYALHSHNPGSKGFDLLGDPDGLVF